MSVQPSPAIPPTTSARPRSRIRSGFAAILRGPEEIIIPQSVALVFIILALVVVFKDWRSDLVESRRRLRLVLLVATGIYALVTSLAVFILLGMPTLVDIQVLDTIHVGIIFLLCLGVSVGWYSVPSQFIAASTAQPPDLESPPEDFTPIIVELKRLMHEEHAYCEHGLSN